MTNVLLIIQFVLVAVICICVLLQKSSNIGLGSYSGSNESLFGAKGPAGFLAKFTFVVGVLFVANTIALGYFYNKNTQKTIFDSDSTIKSVLPPKPITQSVVPLEQNVEQNKEQTTKNQ